MTVYGWIGGGISVIYNIPQIYHVYRIKEITGVSHASILLRIVSYLLVIYHSFMSEDPAIMYTTVAGLVQLFIIYSQLWMYSQPNKQTNEGTTGGLDGV